MLKLVSDADVNGGIVRGLLRRGANLDLVRSQDVLTEGTPDPEVLRWAASEGRILITNDRSTMLGFAFRRVATGESVPGAIATTEKQSVGDAINDILFIAESMPEQEIRDRIAVFLPLRQFPLA